MTERRNKRERDQATFEELVPVGAGRGTARDRRALVGAKMHGAARQRDADADGLDAAAGMAAGAESDDGELRARLGKVRDKRQRREDASTRAQARHGAHGPRVEHPACAVRVPAQRDGACRCDVCGNTGHLGLSAVMPSTAS